MTVYTERHIINVTADIEVPLLTMFERESSRVTHEAVLCTHRSYIIDAQENNTP